MQRLEGLNLEDKTRLNILNFIRTIHLNNQDFIESSFDTEYFGELPMSFRKNAGQAMGLIIATVGSETRKFVFTDRGYEELEDILKLAEG